MNEPSGTDGGNAAQIAYWNDWAGQTWARLQDRLDELLEPISAAALEAAAPVPGEQVIDVGSGCGATLVALARRVRPTGEAIGLDVSEPMSARARERIAAEGLTNATIIIGDAAEHTLAPHAADLLFSRFGVMFFKDPVAAFARLHSAIRPGGRLLCVVWRDPAENAWMRLPLEAARPLLPPQPPTDPLAPGPYAFADRDRVQSILKEAGWQRPEIFGRDFGLCLAPAGDVSAAVDLAFSVGPLARIVAEMEPETRPPVRQAVMSAFEPHDTPAGLVLNGAVWLVSARA